MWIYFFNVLILLLKESIFKIKFSNFHLRASGYQQFLQVQFVLTTSCIHYAKKKVKFYK